MMPASIIKVFVPETGCQYSFGGIDEQPWRTGLAFCRKNQRSQRGNVTPSFRIGIFFRFEIKFDCETLIFRKKDFAVQSSILIPSSNPLNRYILQGRASICFGFPDIDTFVGICSCFAILHPTSKWNIFSWLCKDITNDNVHIRVRKYCFIDSSFPRSRILLFDLSIFEMPFYIHIGNRTERTVPTGCLTYCAVLNQIIDFFMMTCSYVFRFVFMDIFLIVGGPRKK